MKKEIEIFSVTEKLPEDCKKVLCFGEAAGASPSMGGAYWFITHRIENPPKGINKRYIDENGFVASYVTYWSELPGKHDNAN